MLQKLMGKHIEGLGNKNKQNEFGTKDSVLRDTWKRNPKVPNN